MITELLIPLCVILLMIIVGTGLVTTDIIVGSDDQPLLFAGVVGSENVFIFIKSVFVG